LCFARGIPPSHLRSDVKSDVSPKCAGTGTIRQAAPWGSRPLTSRVPGQRTYSSRRTPIRWAEDDAFLGIFRAAAAPRSADDRHPQSLTGARREAPKPGSGGLGAGLRRGEKIAIAGGTGRSEKPAPDARAAPPEAHESLIGRKTVEEVPLAGLPSFRADGRLVRLVYPFSRPPVSRETVAKPPVTALFLRDCFPPRSPHQR
jgi:hypothetical protein